MLQKKSTFSLANSSAAQKKVTQGEANLSHEPHWPSDKPKKVLKRLPKGQSQDLDRHNKIRHADPQSEEE